MNFVITGAGRGIGLETVKKLIQRGENRVLAISRNTKDLENLDFENLKSLAFDLSDFHNYDALCKEISQFFEDRVDVLINNAGQLIQKPYEKTSQQDFDRMLQVNLKVPYFLIQKMLPFMCEETHIVNISSMGGFQGSVKFPGLSAYSISKGALCTLTEALSAELSSRNIKVNALCLGAVNTPMLANAFPDYQALISSQQMGDYIANFAQTGHHFYNGKVLPVSLSTP